MRLRRLTVVANPITENQPLLFVARLAHIVSDEDFRLVPRSFLDAGAIWRRARAKWFFQISVFLCRDLVIVDD